MVMSYAVSAPCGELTALCRSEPERLAIQKHLPGDGWEGARVCAEKAGEWAWGRWPHAGRFSLCPRVPLQGRLCAELGKNWSLASES